MRALFIGDVVGRPGRQSVARWVPDLREQCAVDLVVANGENAAGGLGATPETLRELREAGVDAITLGNHVWRKREMARSLDKMDGVVRPANYPPGSPGKGAAIVKTSQGHEVGLVSLVGRVFMEPLDCPFAVGRREVDLLRETTPIILVDMHAEATSEKVAMGWHLDGRCSAVLGTHTHVQTADERILPGGSAYITDVGMTGPFDSVIGVEVDRVITKFVTGMPTEFRVAKGRPGLNAVCLEIEDDTGRARSIERIVRFDEDWPDTREQAKEC